jgi:hypothetical protein
LSQKAHNWRFPAQLPFYKQLSEKRKGGRLCHLLALKELQDFKSFTMICRKPNVASSICLRATIFQIPEGTL